MKNSIIAVIAILFVVAAVAEGAAINLREKRHHPIVPPGSGGELDPGFGQNWHDQFRPKPQLYGQGGSQASAKSQAKAGSQGYGGFGGQAFSQAGSKAQSGGYGGGAGSFSNAGSSAGANGALTGANSESKAGSFNGGDGGFSSASSSASASANGNNYRPHYY